MSLLHGTFVHQISCLCIKCSPFALSRITYLYMNHQQHQYTSPYQTRYQSQYQHSSCWPLQQPTTTNDNDTVPRTRTTTYYYYPVVSESKPTQIFDLLSVAQTPRPHTPPTPELSHCSTPATSTPNITPQTKPAKMRTVSFGMPEGARDAGFDERDVMKKFNSHVSRCDTCYDNLSAWRSGRPLCSRGHGYVLDMKPYFFFKGGKPYSMIDREKRDERNRVFVPAEYRYVNTLFEALDSGYITGTQRSGPKPKIVIHQPSPAPVQEVAPRREHRQTLKPIVIPTERYVVASSPRSPRSPTSRYRDERYHREPRRGSLYHEESRRRYHHDAEVAAAPDRYYR